MSRPFRYLTFGYTYYYPSGGLFDVIGKTHTLGEARVICLESGYEQYQILDCETGKATLFGEDLDKKFEGFDMPEDFRKLEFVEIEKLEDD